MTNSASPPSTAQSNIETVVQLEEEEERHRSFADRFPEMIGSFAGSVAFVVCQLAFVGLWAVANSGVVPGLPAFDPFPYSLLSGGHRQLDWLWSRQGRRGRPHERLCPSGHAGDLGPGLEGLGPGGAILTGGAVIAAEVEQVGNLIVSGEEALSLAGRLEPLHVSLSSSGRLVRILRSVV